ncbi:unnamed protein product, partial [Musa hybrid cultivar]
IFYKIKLSIQNLVLHSRSKTYRIAATISAFLTIFWGRYNLSDNLDSRGSIKLSPQSSSTTVLRASGSPPVPVMHSPSRAVTMTDQQDWKIPRASRIGRTRKATRFLWTSVRLRMAGISGKCRSMTTWRSSPRPCMWRSTRQERLLQCDQRCRGKEQHKETIEERRERLQRDQI